MEDLPVLDFEIQSHSGAYQVTFNNELIGSETINSLGTHYLIDRNVFPLLGESFYTAMAGKDVILIDATEDTKSYRGVEPIIQQLIEKKLKRDSVLVAIGGGITQDITCFIATTFMRGIKWVFVPTTLLAQADSCIGSKSSINFGGAKNILGSFTPPNHVIISEQFLTSLDEKDIKSGIGEIIKLYIVNGQMVDSERIRNDLTKHLYATLQIKKRFIEEDEFDKGIRNILNYGHCFGHAIEAATHFAIPHGIAVTIGMDVANRFAYLEKLITQEQFTEMRFALYANYLDYIKTPIRINDVFAALTKDKKNTGSKINLILPVGNALEKRGFENNNAFWDQARLALLQTPITVQS